MGFYKYIAKLWQSPKKEMKEEYKERFVQWRKEPVTVRVENPTRIDKARALGYKAKQGYIIVRQRVTRGGHTREQIAGGRRPKKFSPKKMISLNHQSIAERRANDKYVNCEVLNSYWVGNDGKHSWYEVILLDAHHPVIKADHPWVAENRGRVYIGKTSSQRKSRGLRNKGIGAEKARPSTRAKGGKLH